MTNHSRLRTLRSLCLGVLIVLWAGIAPAGIHTWDINEVFTKNVEPNRLLVLNPSNPLVQISRLSSILIDYNPETRRAERCELLVVR